MKKQQVTMIVSDILSIQPLAATRMTFGHNSIVYDVALPDRNVIGRTNTNAHVFAKTAGNITILAQSACQCDPGEKIRRTV